MKQVELQRDDEGTVRPDMQKLQMIRRALTENEPILFQSDDLIGIVDMAISSLSAADIMGRIITRKPKQSVALKEAAAWLDKHAAPRAPCTAKYPADRSESDPHKGRATPATRKSPPGKSTDDAALPAQPEGAPLSRNERTCADRLAAAAESMVGTFREHVGKCAPCTVSWQQLRDTLGQWQSVTR